jgi:hypothetical protein
MRSHFSFVLLASMISEKTSGTWTHLCVTTCPTPPAPMISTLDMTILPLAYGSFCHSGFATAKQA